MAGTAVAGAAGTADPRRAAAAASGEVRARERRQRAWASAVRECEGVKRAEAA